MKNNRGVKNAELRIGPPMRKSRASRWQMLIVFLILNSSFLITSCGVYSFSGTTLSPDIKTVTINNFTLQTAGGPANLPLTLTEKLKEYYQRYTSLKVLPTGGDMTLEGTVTGYDLIAVAPTASDQAGLNRLQVTIQVRFTNAKDDTKSFDQPFSFYKDFPQNQTLSQNEGQLIPVILDQLVLDVFNKTAADW